MFLCGFVSNVFTKIYSYLYWIFLTFFLIQPPLRHQPLPKFLPSSIYPFNNLLHALIERVSRHTSQDLSWFWTKPYKSLKKKPKKLNLILLMLFGFFFFGCRCDFFMYTTIYKWKTGEYHIMKNNENNNNKDVL